MPRCVPAVQSCSCNATRQHIIATTVAARARADNAAPRGELVSGDRCRPDADRTVAEANIITFAQIGIQIDLLDCGMILNAAFAHNKAVTRNAIM